MAPTKLPYKILKELSIPDRPAPWSVTQIDPEKTEAQLAEDLVDFFVKITDEFPPLDGYCPETYSAPFPSFQPHEIAKLIKEGRKPKSAVTGDILPSLVNECSDICAIPATRIINFCLSQGKWPLPWRMETQNAIPKKDGASTFDELRNLSCTNGLPKVLESIVLERIVSEVSLKSNQYGGICGSSTNQFLINMMDKLLRNLEDPSQVVALMSVDFSKAFNRVNHYICLDSLASAGASSDSLSMIAAFLRGRLMRFKVNNTYSSTREVHGGSPQGTKLGIFLFIVTIDRIEEKLGDPTPPPSQADTEEESSDPEDTFGLRGLVGRIGALRSFDTGVDITGTPHKTSTMDSVLRYFNESGRDTSSAHSTLPPVAPFNDPWYDKYVDDVNAGEALRVSEAVLLNTQNRQKRSICARGCQDGFDNISRNAGLIGMRVNPLKTQLLCVSGSNYCESSCHIKTGNADIHSQDSMTLLGFSFGSRPDVSQHVSLIHRKFYVRSWILRHLCGAGVPVPDICRVYSTVIRSSIEYAIPVYHPLLTLTQSDKLEKLQKRALKIIYGYKVSFNEALTKSGLQRLSERRAEIFKKFCVKTSSNALFSHWLPLNTSTGYNLRKERKYKEEPARTERLMRSPIFAMRRLLNELD